MLMRAVAVSDPPLRKDRGTKRIVGCAQSLPSPLKQSWSLLSSIINLLVLVVADNSLSSSLVCFVVDVKF